MKKRILLCIFVIFSFVCAQVHPGKYAKEVNKKGEVQDSSFRKRKESDLIISAVEVTKLSSKYFGVVDFTFENTTGEWINVENIELDFKNKKLNEGVSIPLGEKISLWAKAANARNSIKTYNRRLAALALTAAGGAIASSSDHQNVRNLANAVELVGASYLTVDAIGTSLDKVQHEKLVPKNYLIGNEILIPPGLFARYWILFYTKEPETLPYAKSIYLSCQIKGKQKKYKFDFRRTTTGSEWDQDD